MSPSQHRPGWAQLEAAASRLDVQKSIREAIRRGSIRVIPAPKGGIRIVPTSDRADDPRRDGPRG